VFAVVTGGGTAGHVLPALAVAEGLVARGHDPASIHYVGARRGIEMRLLPQTPFPHSFLDVVGVQRRLTMRNLAVVPRMWTAVREARALLASRRPRVVVSVGGYASLPAALAARRLRIPLVVVSYDRRPGWASALAARWAAACAVAFPGSTLPRAEVTGAPVRQRILDVDRDADRSAARESFGLPADRFVLAVTGGSQGSGAVNAAVARYAASHRDDGELAIRQVVGERFLDATAPVTPSSGASGLVHQVVGYEDRIDLLYAAADLLVGRGGASTVAEVAVTGTPAVLVPWSGAAEDHQRLNVAWLAEQDAAVLLPEEELSRLGDVVEDLRSDAPRRQSLAAKAAAAGAASRGGAVAALVERVALASP
jgi:UDP-N-acetylglucosamine:LPS N-acetylglucosamine transferase